MDNNAILRRIRYTFDLSDSEMIHIFGLAEQKTDRAEISNWLKKDDAEDFKGLYDIDLASFLNGFINLKRGKKEGPQPKPEKTLSNNLVLRKLKIALELKDEDIIEILALADIRISKHEISAFFRNPNQRQYRHCKDQFLRNFLFGMQIRFRKRDTE